MFVKRCEDQRAHPDQARRSLIGAALFAGAILAAAGLRSNGLLPGVDWIVMAAATCASGWILNPTAVVRGLPLTVGLIGMVALLGFAAAGLHGGGLPPGATLYVGVLLSATARSYRVGVAAMVILVAAEALGAR